MESESAQMKTKTSTASSLPLVDHSGLLSDAERTPWRSRSYWIKYSPLAMISVLLVLVTVVGMFGTHGWATNSSSADAFKCDANGGVWAAGGYSPSDWDSEYALSITFGFGKLGYTSAKAIDVAWDIVVGRGGQLLVAGLVYRVFRRALVLAMRDRALPFETFIVMQYSTVTASAISAYAKDIRRRQSKTNARQVFTALALVYCATYALVMPTWLAAMTGYQAATVPLIRWYDGSYIDVENLQPCQYVLVDGDRVGQWANECVPVDSDLRIAVANYTEIFYTQDTGTSPFSSTAASGTSEGIASTFYYSNRTYSIPPPLLNITLLGTDPYSEYTFQNRTMSVYTILQPHNAVCQPQSTYHWGFSFMLLWTYLVFSCAFVVVLYGVWLDTLRFELDRHTRHMYGTLTTALEVGSAIAEELGDAANGLKDKKLRHQLRQRGAGMRLRSRRTTRKAEDTEEGEDGLKRLSVSSTSTFRVDELRIGDQ